MHNLANDRAPRNTNTTEPTRIRVDTFQPFESRQGFDEVVRLRFDYSHALVARLKAILAVYAVGAPQKVVGGWLPEHRCWFVEPEVWDVVRDELQFLGHQIVERKP